MVALHTVLCARHCDGECPASAARSIAAYMPYDGSTYVCSLHFYNNIEMRNGNCWCKYYSLLQHRSIYIAFEIPRSYFRYDQFTYCCTCRTLVWNSRKKSMSKMLSAFLSRFFACSLICALSTCEICVAAWQWINKETNFFGFLDSQMCYPDDDSLIEAHF